MEHHLAQTQTQKLILAPQLRQFLTLLQLPVFELRQKIEQELTQNPVLEEVSKDDQEEMTIEPEPLTEPSTKDDRVSDTLQVIESFNGDLNDQEFSTDFSEADPVEVQRKRDYQQASLTKSPTLSDYLEWQLGILDLSATDKMIAREIIGNINDDGRLVASVEELARATSQDAHEVEKVLRRIQSLDPPGVGARSLQETLLIQLRKLENSNLAQSIIEHHFDLFKRMDLHGLARALHTTVPIVKAAHEQITRLEPKPGRIFYREKPQCVIPDAKISIASDREDEFTVEMNQESVPELRINPMYRQMLRKKGTDKKTKSFIRDKIQSGLDVIRAMAQRKATIQLITEELIRAQPDFFTKGFSHLKPLRLKDVADRIHLHESTVSRSIQGKYVETPQGTIPYKSFFSTKLSGENGMVESQKSVMERLKQIIAKENKRKPFSDQKLVQILKQEGIQIARRTVAKYRDLLHILPTHLRKQR